MSFDKLRFEMRCGRCAREWKRCLCVKGELEGQEVPDGATWARDAVLFPVGLRVMVVVDERNE